MTGRNEGILKYKPFGKSNHDIYFFLSSREPNGPTIMPEILPDTLNIWAGNLTPDIVFIFWPIENDTGKI